MISCQVALYPLADPKFTAVIDEALARIEAIPELHIEVGPMSTYLLGEQEKIWDALQILFQTSIQNDRKIVMNVQMSNECGCDL